MQVSDFIILATALLALALGAYSVIDARAIRKRQYKHALLGDIADWATDCMLCANMLDTIHIAKKIGERSRVADLSAKWEAGVALLSSRIKHIEGTSSVLKRDLHNRVADMRISLEKYRQLASEHLEGKIGEDDVLKQLTKLNLRVRELMHEVSKTRT